MAVPYTFGTATASIPLSQLDSNFSTAITLGNTAIQLGNTVTTLNNMTLANVTISSGNLTLTNVSATTANVTTANVVTLIVTGNETVQGNTTVTGTITGAKLIPTGTSVTGNGMYLPATNSVGISTAGTNAVYIDASQNVGIGITSPTHKLHIVDTTYASLYIKSSSTNFAGMEIENTNSATKWTVGVEGGAYNTAGLFTIGIDGVGAKAAIDSSGNLLVGTTSVISLGKISNVFDGITQFGATFKTTATILGSTFIGFINSAGTQQGSIYANATNTVQFLTSSDYRLKEDITPMTGALAKVQALNPVTYKWKSDGSVSQGFIAHELQAVVPECVGGEKDAVDADGNPKYQGIDTSFLVATLTSAIQELKALVDTQASTITSLTARITALEAA